MSAARSAVVAAVAPQRRAGRDGGRLGDAFRFEDLEVERVTAGSVTITVVTPETLYRMKRDTVRLRDRDDAERLARAFGFGSGEER